MGEGQDLGGSVRVDVLVVEELVTELELGGRRTAAYVASFSRRVPKPSTCCTITSPGRGTIFSTSGSIARRNWWSRNNFSGSCSARVSSETYAEAALISAAEARPTTSPGTSFQATRHSGSSAIPTFGCSSAHR